MTEHRHTWATDGACVGIVPGQGKLGCGLDANVLAERVAELEVESDILRSLVKAMLDTAPAPFDTTNAVAAWQNPRPRHE